MTDSEVHFKKAKQYALSLLAKREYASKTLKEKLRHYGLNNEQADVLLEDLIKKKLQSDARFAECFIRYSLDQGRGLFRIQNELKQKGIDFELTKQIASELNPDWLMLCLKRMRKYIKSDKDLIDKKCTDKLKYHLSYHGFSFDEINQAIQIAQDEANLR